MQSSTDEHIGAQASLEPPGGVLIWLIVFVELITFMMGMGAFLVQRQAQMTAFRDAQRHLDPLLGCVNTLALVTAGFFMAMAMTRLRQGDNSACAKHIVRSILLGIVFLLIKGLEYGGKLSQGLDIQASDFFMFYWLLTGFHFIHVAVGVVILTCLLVAVRKGCTTPSQHADVEAGAIFWHMCDLIWLLLFPILYLL